jgi:hypothetical protein
VGKALAQYGEKLDIVYDQSNLDQVGYQKLIYWKVENKTT